MAKTGLLSCLARHHHRDCSLKRQIVLSLIIFLTPAAPINKSQRPCREVQSKFILILSLNLSQFHQPQEFLPELHPVASFLEITECDNEF